MLQFPYLVQFVHYILIFIWKNIVMVSWLPPKGGNIKRKERKCEDSGFFLSFFLWRLSIWASMLAWGKRNCKDLQICTCTPSQESCWRKAPLWLAFLRFTVHLCVASHSMKGPRHPGSRKAASSTLGDHVPCMKINSTDLHELLQNMRYRRFGITNDLVQLYLLFSPFQLNACLTNHLRE